MQNNTLSFFQPAPSKTPNILYHTTVFTNTPIDCIMTPPPTPPPDKINVNAIANPADDSIESLSSPTTLFSTDPSNVDSFLSEQCLPPALVDNRPKRKSNQQIASSPSRTKRPSRSFPHRAALRAVVRGVASASRRDVAHQAPRRVSPPSAAQSAFDNPLPPPLPLPPPPPPLS